MSKSMIRNILLISLCFFFYGAFGYAQQYEQEIKVVNDFLNQKGISAENCQLQLTSAKPEYLLFKSKDRQIFVLVATEKYHPNLENPILAYGFEGGLSYNDGSAFYNLISVYKDQLNYLYEKRLRLKRNLLQSYKPRNQKVNPLLGETAWGQHSPYNNLYFRNQAGNVESEKHLVGCVPVAMSQVMRYHKHPQKGEGLYAYETKSGDVLAQNFSNLTFNWSLMKDTYEGNDTDSASTTSVAKLMAAAGLSVGADFGRFGTGANCDYIKMALINFFGYAPSCAYVKNYLSYTTPGRKSRKVITQSPDCILGLTYRELDNSRPIIVSNEGHAFVCDGYDGEFLHFNLGWNGYCNGFYRTIIIPGMDEYPLLYNDMVIGIEPDKHSKMAKKVNVQEAGTLESLLTDYEKRYVHALVIEGELNAKDIRLIRRMAGAVDDLNYFKWRGTLSHIDLRNVTLKQDKNKESYLKENAQDIGFSIWYANQKFDFTNISDEQWQWLCNQNVRLSGRSLTKSEDKYYINYFIQKNEFGTKMFSECNNLKTILLPNTTHLVGSQAFWNCHSLQQIHLPQKVGTIMDHAFGNTYLLHGVRTDNPDIEFYDIFNDRTSILNKGIVYKQDISNDL